MKKYLLAFCFWAFAFPSFADSCAAVDLAVQAACNSWVTAVSGNSAFTDVSCSIGVVTDAGSTLHFPLYHWLQGSSVNNVQGASTGCTVSIDPPVDPKVVCDALNATGAPLVGTGSTGLDVIYNGVRVTGSGAAGGFKNGQLVGDFSLFGPFSCTLNSAPLSDNPAACIAAGGNWGQVGGANSCIMKTSAIVSPSLNPKPSTCSGDWGTVNGEDRCLPHVPNISSGGAASSSSSSSKTEGGVTTDGVVKSDTVCDGKECVTTKITTNTSGGGSPITSTEKKTETMGDYCKANPTVAMCAAASDPCTTNPDRVGCLKTGSAASTPSFGNSDSGFRSITSVIFSNSPVCPVDIPISFMGRNIALSYAGTCDVLDRYIKPILLVLAGGFAAFIFVSGFKA